jgi:rusticyanin
MTRLEQILSAALAIIVLGGSGYAAGRVTAPDPSRQPGSSAAAVPPTTTSTTISTGAGSSTTSLSGSQPGSSATGYRNDALATQIAQQEGTQLAADSPTYTPIAQMQVASETVPTGANIDKATNTLTFQASTVSFTVVSVPPGGPDMTFRIAGLVNPTLVVPKGATVTVQFINADTDQAHGWEVTAAQPPFQFHPGPAAFAGAFARGLGDPTAAGDGTETITFTADKTGIYQYVCPMPGHAQMGMHGAFNVR